MAEYNYRGIRYTVDDHDVEGFDVRVLDQDGQILATSVENTKWLAMCKAQVWIDQELESKLERPKG